MPETKTSIRIGIKNTGWFPNAGIIVIKTSDKVASILVLGFDKLRTELRNNGGADIADKLVCEYR